MMDFTGCPKKIVHGETWYFDEGMWWKMINSAKDLTTSDLYHLESSLNTSAGSSREAMVKGCYNFQEIVQVEGKVPADYSGRFIGRALYNRTPDEDWNIKKGGPVEVVVRVNPLLNLDAKSSVLEKIVIKHGGKPEKILNNFKLLFLNKKIQLIDIELVPNKYGSKSYVYEWEYI